MDALAQQGTAGTYDLPRAHVNGSDFDMSFSGLKTAVVNLAHNAAQTGPGAGQGVAGAGLYERCQRYVGAPRYGGGAAVRTYHCGGGRRCSSQFHHRADLQRACREHGYRLYVPPLSLCGDNGAMIGAQGYYEFRAGRRAETDLNAFATLDIAAG